MLETSYEPLDWKRLVNVDLPRVDPITDELIAQNLERSYLMDGGDVRLATGRILTVEGLENYRDKVNSRPLP